MSKEQTAKKIIEETDLDEDELKEEVEEKMDEFSGLVSEEGALHLVAKEHEIEIAESSDQALKIDNIVPEMRNVNFKARVVSILDPNTFERDDGEEGKVQNIVLGDDTGTIRMTLWDEQTEIAEKVDEDDAIKIGGAYTVEDDRGNAEIRLGDESQVKMADDDEVPELENQGGSGEAEKVDIREVKSENGTYTVRGMLMAVYTSNPFYRTCPECGNTVREDDDDELVCPDHGEVEPDNALAVSAVLDDGTDNLRVVFFRDQARKVLEVDEETEKEGKIRKVENAADEAIGKELEVTGRTRYNDYFGTLELMVNEVNEIDADEQIKELMDLMEA